MPMLRLCASLLATTIFTAPALAQSDLQDRVEDTLDWIFADGTLTHDPVSINPDLNDVAINNLTYIEGDRTLVIDEIRVRGIVYDGAWWAGMDSLILGGVTMSEDDNRFELALLILESVGLTWEPILDLLRGDDPGIDEDETIARFLLSLDIDTFLMQELLFDTEDQQMSMYRLLLEDFRSGIADRLAGDAPLPDEDELILDYLRNLSVGAYRIEDLSFSEEDDLEMTLGEFRVTDVADEVVGAFSIDELAVIGDDRDFEGEMGLERLRVVGLDVGEIADVLGNLSSMEFPGFFWAPYEYIDLVGFVLDTEAVTLTVPSYGTEAPSEAIDGTIRQTGGITGLSIEFGGELLEEESFRELGLERIVIDAAGTVVYDPVTRDLSIEGRVNGGEIGEIEVNYTLGGLSEDLVMGNGGNVMAMMGATLVSAGFSWEERGFLRRLLDAVAHEQRSSADALIEELLAELRETGKGEQDGPDLSGFVVDLGNFLRNGGTLRFTVSPPSPLPIAALATVDDPVAELGIMIDHHP